MRMHRWVAGIMAFALGFCAGQGLSEAQISLPPEDIYGLEVRLNGLGYLTKEADQSWDDETQQALESFQQANGLSVTGQLDSATVAVLERGDGISRQDYLRGFIKSYQEMEPLKSGDIKNQVQTMQRKLLDYGYFNGNADGVFGDATRMAVERFQMVNGLPITGVADGMTLMRLMADVPITWQGYLSEMSCAAGDSGLNVYVLQKKLDEMGYFDGDCTGSFGDLTQQAVARFQADNGLEATGAADAALWGLIYSGSAVARRRSDVIQLGDTGENVAQIQRRLHDLGYLNQADDGNYGYATETAVRLFQMANELTSTGRVGSDTLSALLSDTARPLGDPAAQERFATLLTRRDASLQSRIGEIAVQLVGTEFNRPDDPLYPGFALVQYACVAAGLPVTAPEALIRLADDPVESADEVGLGNVLAFQTAGSDSVTMLLTIGAGEGRIVYATPEIGWVVMSYVNQIDSESVYCWAEGDAAPAMDTGEEAAAEVGIAP